MTDPTAATRPTAPAETTIHTAPTHPAPAAPDAGRRRPDRVPPQRSTSWAWRRT